MHLKPSLSTVKFFKELPKLIDELKVEPIINEKRKGNERRRRDRRFSIKKTNNVKMVTE